MKNTVVIIALMVAFVKASYSQQVNWKQTNSWKIYEIVDRQAIQITSDSLKLLRGIPIQKDSILYFISDVIVWPSTKNAVWIGAYTLTYELVANQPRKLLVSSYGGFMYDSHNKQYYEIDEAKRNSWYAFLISYLNKEQ